MSDYRPRGDQAQAIEQLVRGLVDGEQHQVLLGVTGSGKTYTMARVTEQMKRPTLVLAHNKTLGAQLYHEFKAFFPHSAVEYFVSYYDYYQPEAYLPASDTYIEKEATINDELDKLRLSATRSLFERRDCVLVASVSCIYGLGSPEAYYGMLLMLEKGQKAPRAEILKRLVEIQYARSEAEFKRGTFRVRGDVIEVFPTYDDYAYRIELWGDQVESLAQIDPLLGQVRQTYLRLPIYPKTHYVMDAATRDKAIESILEELAWLEAGAGEAGQVRRSAAGLSAHHVRRGDDAGNRLLPRHRELLSPFLRAPARRSPADAARLPAARRATAGGREPPDHPPAPRHVSRRPLSQGEPGGLRVPPALGARQPAVDLRGVRASRQPGDLRLRHAWPLRADPQRRRGGRANYPADGLVDPEVEVRPVKGQVDDLLGEIRARATNSERVLVTTLTKRMAEDLAEYYGELGVRCRYLHSEIETLERVKILRDLRRGEFDVLIGINLLREGLDLPEVSLVAILDADKEGFLRSQGSLIQTIGRAARHINGRALLYADTTTDSMRRALEETDRRRAKQIAFNLENNITPQSVIKPIDMSLVATAEADYVTVPLDLPRRGHCHGGAAGHPGGGDGNSDAGGRPEF